MMIFFGALAALLVAGAAVVLLLRSFFNTRVSFAETMERAEVSWRDYRPMQRLLDPADFEYLRRKGIGAERIQKLKVQRRKLYRASLRNMAGDFNQVHQALSLLLIHSQGDRPELAAELARQRFVFYRNLLTAEFRLTLNACGIESMPAVDLFAPLAALQSQFQQLAAAGSAA